MTDLPEELERLSQALALSEGFQILILECHGLASWDLHRLFDLVQVRVAELRGVAPLVLVYDPHVTTEDEGSLRDEAWVEGVLGAILKLPPPSTEGASLVAVVDGTGDQTADRGELGSWTFLFHRLNERRNVLARTLVGTLALALTPALVRLFLGEASDSASIRSGMFRLDRGLLPAALRPPVRPALSSYPEDLVHEAFLRRRIFDPGLSQAERASARAELTLPEPSLAPLSARQPQPTRGDEVLASRKLERLLLSLFSADELRRFLHYLPDGEWLVNVLPGPTASPKDFAHAAVSGLERTGVVADPSFWERLLAERPRRRAEIEQVRKYFEVSRPAAASRTPRLEVLFLSIGDDPAAHLRNNLTLRDLVEALRTTANPDRLVFNQTVVYRPEFLGTMLRHEPDVLVLDADEDSALQLQNTRFLRLFSTAHKLRLVIVQAPYARAIAQWLAQSGKLAIAIEETLFDVGRTQQFLATFFESVAVGKTVEDAFTAACGSIEGDEELHPELFPSPEEDRGSRRATALL